MIDDSEFAGRACDTAMLNFIFKSSQGLDSVLGSLPKMNALDRLGTLSPLGTD